MPLAAAEPRQPTVSNDVTVVDTHDGKLLAHMAMARAAFMTRADDQGATGVVSAVSGAMSGTVTGEGLLAELLAINVDVAAGALELERLTVSAARAEGTALSAARLRCSKALRRHLQLVDGALLSHLRATVAAADKPALDAYRRQLHAYHEAAAYHVARWPSTNVAADRDGYRRSVGEMLGRLRLRIDSETCHIHPLLADAGKHRAGTGLVASPVIRPGDRS